MRWFMFVAMTCFVSSPVRAEVFDLVCSSKDDTKIFTVDNVAESVSVRFGQLLQTRFRRDDIWVAVKVPSGHYDNYTINRTTLMMAADTLYGKGIQYKCTKSAGPVI